MLVTDAIVAVDAGPEHAAFVRDSFRWGLEEAGVADVRAHVEMLGRDIRGRLGRTLVAVPSGHPSTFLGWASKVGGSLLFVYVPHNLRGWGISRHLVSWLMPAGGPVPLVYWTGAAQRAHDRGFPLVHDWPEFRRRQRLIESVRRTIITEGIVTHEGQSDRVWQG